MIKGGESDLITEVSGGQLKIKNQEWLDGSVNAKTDVKVYYTQLEEVEAAAGASVSGKSTIKAEILKYPVLAVPESVWA